MKAQDFQQQNPANAQIAASNSQPPVHDVGVDAVAQSHARHRGAALPTLLRNLAL